MLSGTQKKSEQKAKLNMCIKRAVIIYGILIHHLQGAAFGVSSIAAQAKEQFAPYLPSLVPRLYRYKYDPIPRIQLAMSSIWNAVVPHSKKTVSRMEGVKTTVGTLQN